MNDYAGNIKITLKNTIEISCRYVKINDNAIEYKLSKNEPLKTIKKITN